MTFQFTAQSAMARVRTRLYAAASIVIVLCIYFLSASLNFSPRINGASTTTGARNNNKLNRAKINNATLGFGHIYALNLPIRSDKRDGMDLAATISNLTLTWRDGVNGSTMHPNAIPPAHLGYREFTKDAEVGCWRGHMNILREIVTSGLGSALILEDDADWDVNIRSQMVGLASSVQETISLLPEERRNCQNNGKVGERQQDSPYGACWDILWVGHCGGWAPNEKNDAFHSIIRDDRTVPPAFDMEDLTREVKLPCTAHVGRKLKDNIVCQSPALQETERIVSTFY